MNILYLVCEQFVTAHDFRKRKQIRVGVDSHIDPKTPRAVCNNQNENQIKNYCKIKKNVI